MTALIPRQSTPDLDLPLVGGGRFTLSTDHGPNGSMLVFYRGLHCPICHKQLRDMAERLPAFAERGVVPVAISSDGQDRAETLAKEIGAPDLKIAYDFPLTAARDDWGLYISTTRGTTSVGVPEPDLFHEPGLMLVKPNRTLYYLSVQTMPHGRPPFDDILKAFDAAIERDYPARGHYTGPL